MKTKHFAVTAMVALWLVGCGDNGVPPVADPHAIVVDGKPMKQAEFLSKYCVGKEGNATCAAVSKAASEDSLRRGLPKGY